MSFCPLHFQNSAPTGTISGVRSCDAGPQGEWEPREAPGPAWEFREGFLEEASKNSMMTKIFVSREEMQG